MSKIQLPGAPNAGLFKQGYQSFQSEDGVVNKNISAVREIAGMVRTSVGPSGRNKIIVNHLQKVFLTSDASTILRELDIVHPAVKVLVMAAQQQELELGDASNLVVVLAGEILSQAEELLRIGMSPSEVVQGFEKALGFVLESLDEQTREVVSDVRNAEQLQVVLRSVIAPKQYGNEELIAELVGDAVAHVMPPVGTAPTLFNPDNVRVVKIMGASLESSRVIKGMVFPTKAEGSVLNASNAKVAVFTSPVDIVTTETKGTVLLHNAQEMLDFSKGEEHQIEALARTLRDDLGVGVIVAGAGVGSLVLHYLNRAGILVFRVGSKFDLQRLCRVTGSSALPHLPTKDAPISAEALGHIDEVEVTEIGGDRVTVFRQKEATATRTATIVLRGATQQLLDDVERAVDDGVSAVKALTRDPRMVPGAGAAEITVARHVQRQGERTPGVLQHAVKKFGVAFEVIPRTLAENAGLDATAVVASLYATPGSGVDIEAQTASMDDDRAGVLDAAARGIWDVSIAKQSAVKLATQACCTILTVDQIIMAKRSGGPAMPKQGGDWDQD